MSFRYANEVQTSGHMCSVLELKCSECVTCGCTCRTLIPHILRVDEPLYLMSCPIHPYTVYGLEMLLSHRLAGLGDDKGTEVTERTS
jgi:hypothetical protein